MRHTQSWGKLVSTGDAFFLGIVPGDADGRYSSVLLITNELVPHSTTMAAAFSIPSYIHAHSALCTQLHMCSTSPPR